MNAKDIYYLILAGLAAVGTTVAEALGGWDPPLKTLAILMVIDYATGALCAAVWHKSPKTPSGTYDTRAGFKGLIRKGAIILIVYIAAKLDVLMGTSITRTAVILFFTANEGFSIIENMGIMGVPMPQIVKDGFAVLRKQSGTTEAEAAAIPIERDEGIAALRGKVDSTVPEDLKGKD
jgi:toxin secretion/phage lysis holin